MDKFLQDGSKILLEDRLCSNKPVVDLLIIIVLVSTKICSDAFK